MHVIICGSRDWTDAQAIESWIARKMGLSDVLIHGGARGADTIAGEFWKTVNITKGSLRVYEANWKKHGGRAGVVRNREMLDKEEVDLVMAFPLSESRGTWDMVREARRRGIQVEVYGEA